MHKKAPLGTLLLSDYGLIFLTNGETTSTPWAMYIGGSLFGLAGGLIGDAISQKIKGKPTFEKLVSHPKSFFIPHMEVVEITRSTTKKVIEFVQQPKGSAIHHRYSFAPVDSDIEILMLGARYGFERMIYRNFIDTQIDYKGIEKMLTAHFENHLGAGWEKTHFDAYKKSLDEHVEYNLRQLGIGCNSIEEYLSGKLSYIENIPGAAEICSVIRKRQAR